MSYVSLFFTLASRYPFFMLIPVLNIPVVNGMIINVATNAATHIMIKLPMFLSRKMVNMILGYNRSSLGYNRSSLGNKKEEFDAEKLDQLIQQVEEEIDGDTWVTLG
jgi:hypothetical protein